KKEVMSKYYPDPACEAKAKAEGKSIDDACKQRDFFVIIKPTDDANYKGVVDILDEMTINKVARYALMKPYPTELDLVKVSEGASAAAPAETPAK
ncbi:MAG: biopolymer transporter ExbD, partial [Niabella sp.]